MSRVPKWKVEKTKVKVVFRLQFQATHIPQPGWDKLFISFIPVDTGKVTAKTNKANVRNGNSKWADPIYETTRLLQDTRTKIYDEKFYKLVVTMGTSRSSILGEVNINLADYADALKPSSVALPLEGCEYGTVLHVTIQLLTSKTGFREFEQQRVVGEKGSLPVRDPVHKVQTSAVVTIAQTEKVTNRIKFRPDSTALPSLQEVGESIEDCENFAAGHDNSSHTSESINTEKSDIISTPEVNNSRSVMSVQAGQPRSEEQYHHHLLAEGSSELAHGWISDCLLDNGLTTASEENNRLLGSLEVTESSISRIRVEVSSLQKLADELSTETTNVAQQLTLELASGEALAREISFMKFECMKFKGDLEELKHVKRVLNSIGDGIHLCKQDTLVTMPESTKGPKFDQFMDSTSTFVDPRMSSSMKADNIGASFGNKLETTDAGNQNDHLQGFQIKWLNKLSLVENKVKEIQSKSQLRHNGTDFDILQSDFDTLDFYLLNLKQTVLLNDIQALNFQKSQSLTSEHLSEGDSITVMNAKICELLIELERSKAEQESLMKKMSQMECYYEALIQEIEDGHKNTLNDLNILKAEHSTCFYTVSAYQTQIEKMHEDMNEQLSRFVQDRQSLDSLNKELEKRANASENLLKRIRWNYAIAVDRLQKDLELLSNQVLSMFEANDSIARQAFAEASLLLSDDLFEENSAERQGCLHTHVLQNSIHETQYLPSSAVIPTHSPVSDTERLSPSKTLQNSVFTPEKGTLSLRKIPLHEEMNILKNGKSSCMSALNVEKALFLLPKHNIVWEDDQSVDADVIPRRSAFHESYMHVQDEGLAIEEMKKSFIVLQELYIKTEAELSDMYMMNIYFEVLSKVLQETLNDKPCGIRGLEDEICELSAKLGSSTESCELLMTKLHNMNNDVQKLKDTEAKLVAECDDLTLRNNILEAKLQDISEENSLLSERAAEYQNLTREFKDLEFSYNTCSAAKVDLGILLKQEVALKTCYEKELRSILDEHTALQTETAKQCSINDDLQKVIIFANEKLGVLCSNLASYEQEVGEPANVCQHQAFIDKLMHLEQLQNQMTQKNLRLCEENKETEEPRNIAYGSLNSKESTLQELMRKSELSDALIEKLQMELRNTYENLRSRSETEKLNAEKDNELSSKVAILELALQCAITEKSNIIEKLLGLESVYEELKKTNVNLMTENNIISETLLTFQNINEELERTKLHLLTENSNLANKMLGLESMNEELEKSKLYIMTENSNLAKKIIDLESLNEEFEGTKLHLVSCMQERENLILSIQSANNVSAQLENELCSLKERLAYADNEIQRARCLKEKLDGTITELTSILNESQEHIEENKTEIADLSLQVSDLERTNSGLQSLVLKSEECRTKLDIENCSLTAQVSDLEIEHQRLKECLACVQSELQSEKIFKEKLECKVVDLTLQLDEKCQKLLYLEEQKTELAHLQQLVSELESEKSELRHLLSRNQECTEYINGEISLLQLQVSELENELRSIKERLGCTYDELHAERELREKLDMVVRDLRSQLTEKDEQLMYFSKQQIEYDHLRLQVSDTEEEKSKMQLLLLQSKDYESKLSCENSALHVQVADLQAYHLEMLENILTADFEVIFIRSQSPIMIQALTDQLMMLDNFCKDLHMKYVNEISVHQDLVATNAKYVAENVRLSSALWNMKSEYDTLVSEKTNLVDFTNERSVLYATVENSNIRSVTAGSEIEERHSYEDEIEQLMNVVKNFEVEMDNLRSARDELDITITVLRSKLNEQSIHASLLGEYDIELVRLREQQKELTYRLSEQTLKTEEFKNLSIHLKEIKDKADVEYLQVREKKGTESPSTAVQESLRMAFIKEQCETRVQGLQNQLFVSKRHGEELLLKLQNALGELEFRKKSEVSHLKQNDELSVKVGELEAELQQVMSDRRELLKACDGMKAELECSNISLDCCKEEKLKLEASLQECNEERTKSRVELDLVRRRLDILSSTPDIFEGSHESTSSIATSFGQILEEKNIGISVVLQQPLTARSICLGKDTSSAAGLKATKELGNSSLETPLKLNRNDNKILQLKSGTSPNDVVVSKNDLHVSRSGSMDQDNLLLHNNDFKEQIKEREILKSTLELFHNELQKMKNESLASLVPLGEHFDPDLLRVQQELTQLNMANEHLGNMFPLFKEFPGTGNALKRVLALELELAEALQAKKKDIHFQSSFLKQHSDEEAVFRSFMDINELIKEMLDLKGRYVAVETELNDMQGRYSQLSLQFAEVEGERQKLIMTLKNRTPKRH